MLSMTSSSKGPGLFYAALWKKNMTRFWPIWASYGAFWLFSIPLRALMVQEGTAPYDLSAAEFFARVGVLGLIPVFSTLCCFCFSILAAMAVFSYLYSARSVGFLHALPVRREGLFLTSYLSGLSFLLLPALAVFLLSFPAEAIMGYVDPGALGMWFAAQVLLTLFFFSFASFCAMFTGHILALPAFYGILSVLSYSVSLLLIQVLRTFVFGFSSSELLERLGAWLSPVVQLLSALHVEMQWDGQNPDVLARAVFHGLGYAILYALAGLALAGCALVLYRRRHLEGAGDVVTVAWTRPVFRYGVAACSALSFGLFLYEFFDGQLPRGAWTLLCFMILSGLLGYFVAEMLLKKSVHVFRGRWRGCVVFSLCLAALVAAMELDLTGFERRTPTASGVAGVRLSRLDCAPYDDGRADFYLEDPALIQEVVALHEAVLRERSLHEEGDLLAGQGLYDERALPGASVPVEVQTRHTVPIVFSYDLAGGGRMDREYTLVVTEADLQDPDSAAARLTALISRPELLLDAYFSLPEGYRLTGASLDLLDLETGEYDAYPVPTEDRDALLSALENDIRAGRLGRRYLLRDEERLANCYYTDLTLTYTSERGDSTTVTVTLQTTAAETLSLLQRAGVLDETHVLETQLQVEEQFILEEELSRTAAQSAPAY